MPGVYKELAQKGGAILSKCKDQLKDAEEADLQQGRSVWMEMRQLQERRKQEKGKQLGTASDRNVYQTLHMHFMEAERHATTGNEPPVRVSRGG